MLQWQFLGTSAGTPTKQRNVSALALGQTRHKSWLLIDCGEATQHQLLHTHWSMNTLSAICITHVHGDHCYGLPGAIASASLHKCTAPLTLIGPQALWQWLQHTMALTDMHVSFEIHFIDVETLLDQSVTVDGFVIDAHALHHRVPSYAYRIAHSHTQRRLRRDRLLADQVPQTEVWGQLQKGHDVVTENATYLSADYTDSTSQSVCVVVAGDNDRPECLQAACEGANVLIHEATYTQEVADKVGAFPMHSSAQQVASWAQSVAIPHLMLTHFSARYSHPNALAPLLQEAQAHYHGHVYLAQDFDHYRLSADGQVQLLSNPL